MDRRDLLKLFAILENYKGVVFLRDRFKFLNDIQIPFEKIKSFELGKDWIVLKGNKFNMHLGKNGRQLLERIR